MFHSYTQYFGINFLWKCSKNQPNVVKRMFKRSLTGHKPAGNIRSPTQLLLVATFPACTGKIPQKLEKSRSFYQTLKNEFVTDEFQNRKLLSCLVAKNFYSFKSFFFFVIFGLEKWVFCRFCWYTVIGKRTFACTFRQWSCDSLQLGYNSAQLLTLAGR